MTDNYTLNTTRSYHTDRLNSLGWELTVCNALHAEGTPIRKILARDGSFGHLLYDHLCGLLPMDNISSIIEIGGGYGFLMKDFLERDGSLRATMLDISPLLLNKQRETLAGFGVTFEEGDFLESDPAILRGCDLAVLNENLGDFPTLVNVNGNIFESPRETLDPGLKRVVGLFDMYGLEKPGGKVFNLNIGALEAVEKLCVSGVPYIYLGEHSCEAVAPDPLRSFVRIDSTGNPERIPLKGHDEYTIKFSDLQQVAGALNYTSIRGLFVDFIRVPITDRLRFILASGGRYSDEAEMICQFVEDLYKYEYLILIKQ